MAATSDRGHAAAIADGGGGRSSSGGGGGGKIWPLNAESREKIVKRIADNLTSIAFFTATSGAVRLDDEAAHEHALVIEREAFAAAQAFADGAPAAGGAAAAAAAAVDGQQQHPPKQSAVVLAYAKHASNAMTALLRVKTLPGRARPAPAEAKALAAKRLDLSGGKREFLSKERAEELLKPMLEHNPNGYTEVKLSTKSFGYDSCGVAAKALRNAAATLRVADLSDIIAGRPEDEALASLTEICGALADVPHLTSLKLSDNALGEKGVRACAGALSAQTCLEELHFCNNGISAEAGRALVELLPEAAVATLRTLHFFNNMSGDEGATALSEMVCKAKKLESFRFSSTRVGSEGAIALAQALASTGSGLKYVDMRDNMFGEEGAMEIATAVRNHPNLLEVHLGDTGLGDEGVVAVVKALAETCKQLQVLDLGGCEVTTEGAKRIAEHLSSFAVLKRLVLSENELGNNGAVALAAVLSHNTELEELDLGTNEISDAGAKAAAAAVADLKHMKAGGLNLNGNALSRAAIAAVKELLARGDGKGEEVLGSLDENDDGEEDDEE